MRFLKRGLMAAGALALAAMFLNFVAPKAVHAAVATLVQVVNTISNPAITQDTSKTAAQIVNLEFFPNGSVLTCENLKTGAQGPYEVPSGQTLMITAITITPPDGASGVQDVSAIAASFFPVTLLSLRVTNTATTQFVFPSGIWVPGGFSMGMEFTGPAPTIWVSGYLTTN
jgi:hypothetical protein